MGVYVITGANRGIGLEFVNQLSCNPSNTVIASTRSLSSDLSALKSLNKQHNNIYVLECNTSSFPSIHAFSLAVSKIIGADGKIDYLLNSAAIQDIKDDDSLDLTEHNLLSHIQTNVLGPAEMVKSLLKHLQRGSVVMNMTSGIG
jgi:NAD(P)-dependent dehydrogenase (short-subunit alcohol dehydrogenase family)